MQYISLKIITNSFVTDLLTFRLGLRYNEIETQFEWITGSCELSSFEDWFYYRNGELENYCVQMFLNGWYTVHCRHYRSVVCEIY